MAFNRVQQWATFSRQWYMYDAQWQCPFRSAEAIKKVLLGKHKPIYHPQSDVGDCVVVINSRHIAMEGDYWRTWKHYNHTGYPGGFSSTRAYQVHDVDPTAVLRKAVYASIKGNLTRRLVMERLIIYPEADVPDSVRANLSAQLRQVRPVPRRLEQYTAAERDRFPRLFEWPTDHVINHGQCPPPEEDGKA